jgi:hypothetical protein
MRIECQSGSSSLLRKGIGYGLVARPSTREVGRPGVVVSPVSKILELKARWGAGAHDLADIVPHVAESMWKPAVEVIRVSRLRSPTSNSTTG